MWPADRAAVGCPHVYACSTQGLALALSCARSFSLVVEHGSCGSASEPTSALGYLIAVATGTLTVFLSGFFIFIVSPSDTP